MDPFQVNALRNFYTKLRGGDERVLTRRMLDNLTRLYMVDLLCDPELQPFYARLGMKAASGMPMAL